MRIKKSLFLYKKKKNNTNKQEQNSFRQTATWNRIHSIEKFFSIICSFFSLIFNDLFVAKSKYVQFVRVALSLPRKCMIILFEKKRNNKQTNLIV